MNIYLNANFKGKINIAKQCFESNSTVQSFNSGKVSATEQNFGDKSTIEQCFDCNNDIFLIKTYESFVLSAENFAGINFSSQVFIVDNKVSVTNKLLKVRHINFDNWLITFENVPINLQKVFEKSVTYNDGEAKVEVLADCGSTTIFLYVDNNLKYSKTINKTFKSYVFKKIKIKNSVYLYFLASGEKEKFAILNLKDEIMFADFADEISFGKEKIKILKNSHDCIGHGHAQIFGFNENVPVIDTFGVYIDKRIYPGKHFAPYLFLECVKANNFKQARKYLSDELNKLLDDHKIKEFFNSVYRIEQFRFCENLNVNQLAAFDADENLLAVYKFDVYNGIIENIDML